MPGNIIDWPLIHEYDEALLDRRRRFSDPEIQNSTLSEIHAGLPMHLNGGGCQYVCVYRLDNWVVRCFVSDPPNNVEPPADIVWRYEKITSFLKQVQALGKLEFLTPCELIEPGLDIDGKPYPYLKIPYIANSRSLGDYLSEHYHDYHTTALLAQKWLDITRELGDHQIAHGDLDLSNVLVYGGYPTVGLRLIDFDGMYIPEFASTNLGLTDHGHAHFQPAQRSIRRFDDKMDNFSSLIIYLSLCALEQNPALWDKCEASERNLLLHEEDFQRLAQSTRLRILRNEQRNKPLQLCLDELQESIDKKRMPRSLQEILKGVNTKTVTADNFYVGIQPSFGPYEGIPLPVPIFEPAPGISLIPPPPPVYQQPVSPPVQRQPVRPFPNPVPSTTPSQSSQVGWWIFAIIVIISLIIIFHWY